MDVITPTDAEIDAVVTVLTADEWREAAEERLAELGVTYNELMAQAAERRFANTEIQKLWVFIGGTL